MPTAMTSAISTSRKSQPMTAVLRFAAVAILSLVAGCTTLKPPTVVPPSLPPPAVPSLPATYRQVAFSSVPGWNDDRLQDAWPAFLVGCTALVQPPPRTTAGFPPPCADANARGSRDAVAIRTFFETHFSPYEVVAADGRSVGMVTGYYEPL